MEVDRQRGALLINGSNGNAARRAALRSGVRVTEGYGPTNEQCLASLAGMGGVAVIAEEKKLFRLRFGDNLRFDGEV